MIYFLLHFSTETLPPNFVVSPTTIDDWNLLLAEADKILLKRFLSTTQYEILFWVDDSHKNHEDRHVFGVHTWHPEKGHPVRYVLGNLLIASGSGKDQADTEYHVASKIYGVKNAGALIGDNASTQCGTRNGMAAMLTANFKKEVFFVGCYPHVLNIILKRAAYTGLGSKGDQTSFNVMQLHYKVIHCNYLPCLVYYYFLYRQLLDMSRHNLPLLCCEWGGGERLKREGVLINFFL